MSHPELFFDFACPWSYLALVRMQDVADRNGVRLTLRPVCVQQVLETENPARAAQRFAENPNKAAWQRKDLADWARLWGLRLTLPDSWPFDSRLPCAAAMSAIANGQGMRYALRTFAARYGEGKDIGDRAILQAIAADCGLEADPFDEGLEQNLGALDATAEELVRRGGFGTPTVFVGDDLFFGNDRIPLVDFVLSPISADDFVMPGQHG